MMLPRTVVILLLIGLLARLAAQPVDPYGDSDENPFYGNPFEPDERRLREAELQRDEPANPDEAGTIWNRIFAPRIYDEVFDTPLPGVSDDDSWRFRFNPKFSDIFGDDYIRWPVGVRYNFNTHLEGQFDLGMYTGNPSESGDGAGFYDLEPGFKYTVRRVFRSDVNMAFGLRTRIPFSDPPPEVIDGYARYRPFVSFSRELTYGKEILGYVNLAYEVVGSTPFTAHPVAPEPRDRLFITPGLIYYPGNHFRYGFELEYRTSAIAMSRTAEKPDDYVGPPTREDVLAYEVIHEVIASPSITWFPSKKVRSGMHIPGNWDVGVRLEIPVVEQTGEHLDLSVRVRWYYNYRRLLSRDLPQLFRRGVDN